jgi:hypothetical protein
VGPAVPLFVTNYTILISIPIPIPIPNSKIV